MPRIPRRTPSSSASRTRPGWRSCATRRSGTAPWSPSTTRPARSSPTSDRPTTTRAKAAKKLQPQFDVLTDGWRQPGSAFKPFNYATGINDSTFTASTMFMDVTTDFGVDVLHPDRRRPPRARTAPAAQGAPVLAQHPGRQGAGLQGHRPRLRTWRKLGLHFLACRVAGRPVAWPSARGGPSARPRQRLCHARQRRPVHGPHHDPVGQGRDRQGRDPALRGARGTEAVSPQAAYIVTDILAGNTDPQITRSGASSASGPTRASAARRRSRPAPTTTPRTSMPTATSRPDQGRPQARASTPWPWASGTATATTPWSARPATRSSRSTSRPTSGRPSCRR